MAKNSSRTVGRHFLHIPGPTPLPDRVLRAMDTPIIDHRGPEFARLAKKCLDGIKTIFKTTNPVIIDTATGTGAWEAALVNTLSPGDKVLMVETGQFATLCRTLLGHPEWAADERFATNSARVRNRTALLALLEPEIARKPTAQWLEDLRKADIPCGEVRTVGTALSSPEARARGMVQRVRHPTAGELSLVGSPLKLSATPVVEPSAPPLLGEHTEPVLRERLGMDPGEIARLRGAGVIC